MTQSRQGSSVLNRRSFLVKTGAVGLATAVAVHRFAHGAFNEDMEVNIGLIGCGGRGTGAVLNALGAATKVIYPATGYHTEDVAENATVVRKNIKVVALADLFPDRLEACRANLQKLGRDVPPDRCFVGFDAYKQLLAVPEVNYGTSEQKAISIDFCLFDTWQWFLSRMSRHLSRIELHLNSLFCPLYRLITPWARSVSALSRLYRLYPAE